MSTEESQKTAVSTKLVRGDEFGRQRIGELPYRILEIFPGVLVWLTIILSIVLSFVAPMAVIYFIIIFDIFWFYRIAHFSALVFVGWWRYRRDSRIDWGKRIVSQPRHLEIKHVIFLPFSVEPISVLRETCRALVRSNYPNIKESFIVVLPAEERVAGASAIAEEITREFSGEFFRILPVTHPANLPNERVGKGANNTYAAGKVKELVDLLGIPYEDIVVSSFDCDTIVHPQYFSYLSYKYLTHPNPTRSSYQPMVLYDNNIWEAPAPVRVAAFGTTFWLLGELMRPERLSTFSSHSMPFKALVDVGFWQKDVVSEDSRIFLQCLLHYNGDYTVTPMYVPVAMDTVIGDDMKQSLGALYKQQRRWAWGVENFPYLVSRFWKNPSFPMRKKFSQLWNLIEGMYTWAVAPILIFVLGRLPLFVAPEKVRESVFFQNAPHTLEYLMTLAMVGVVFSAAISLTMLPPVPATVSKARSWLVAVLQWALVPFTFTIFGSFPAVDAQTRLMLGSYLGFNVTKKKR